MKLFFTLFLFFISFFVSAQSTWQLNLSTAIGYNSKEVTLWKYNVKSYPSIGGCMYAGYEYNFSKHFSARIMLGFHQFYTKETVNNIEVSGYNYNFEIPFDIRYTFYNYWTLGIGISAQDYREISDFDVHKSNNIRANIIIDINYQFTKNWAVNFKYSGMLSKQRDSFVVQHYTTHFLIGASFLLGSRPKQYNN